MAAHPAVHPSEDALRAFVLDQLDDNTASVLRSHLNVCPQCRIVVAELPGSECPKMAPTTLLNLPPQLADHPDYEVLRELGRGGMGVVYQARHRLSGRVEVLKVMNKALLGRPANKERFLREIQSAARLDHNNVVKMYTALERGELLVLVMEYVPGHNLAQVVKSIGPLPLVNACCYAQQAAAGLQHAFTKGMVHRDIKPQNLILCCEGEEPIVKILDFGLAKAIRGEDVDAELTSKGAALGSPGYIAPEQSLDAAAADIRADIYGLGCTLYHLLAGVPPFTGRSEFEILQAHHMVEAKPLNLVRAETPEALAAVVRQMMAKKATERYQTPAEVVRALEPFAQGEWQPLPLPPAPPTEGQRDAASPPIAKTGIEGPATIAKAGAKPSMGGLSATELPVIRMRRAATERERRSPNQSLRGCVLGAAMILMLLLGMWIGGVFKANNNDGALTSGNHGKESSEVKPAELPNSITNSLGMKLVLVKPGTFLMGSPADEKDRSEEEEQHEIEITRSFYMGIYEVTQEQYERVMGYNPSSFSSTGSSHDTVQGMDTGHFPVEMVSWSEAVMFCRNLSERPEEKSNGRVYRLPTEAEWEYSCRGGPFIKQPSPPFYFGNSLSSTQANFDGKYPYGGAPKGPYLERTTKVGSYPANSLGLYDLHGNVWEWCADWYDSGYYRRSPRQNPQGPETGNFRMNRGGSWLHSGPACRSARRTNDVPSNRSYTIGFRVVLDLAAKN